MKIKLNEEELNYIVYEATKKILSENVDEGFLDRIKSAASMAKNGYQAQKQLDRGTNGFKTQNDANDVRQSLGNINGKMDNTAADQANDIAKTAHKYQLQRNQLLSQLNNIVKQYGLVKDPQSGLWKNPATSNSAVPDVSGIRGNSNSGKFGRTVTADRNPLANTRGMWE